MPAYIYENEILHINRYRRKGDGSPYGTGSKEVGTDKGRKVRDGIILKDFDRRQNNDLFYNGPERCSGMERRSVMDRRTAARTRYAYGEIGSLFVC